MNKIFLSRTLRASWKNLRRNGVLSFAILAVMAIALFAFQITVFTNLITDTAIALVHKQIDLSVEVREGTQDFQVERTISGLKNLSFVSDALFVPKEVALENFRQNHAEIAGFLDEYGIENPLPNTIFILTDSPERHPSVLNFLEQPEYAQVVDTASASDRLERRTRTARIVEITKGVRQFSLILTGLLLVLGMFTIWNTIRISMHARREEREIMMLVGASPAFIRAPYLWEGVWFGIGAAVVATVISFVVVSLTSPQLASYLAYEPMIFTSSWAHLFPDAVLNLRDFLFDNWLSLLGATAIVGVVFGVVSAALATLPRTK